MGGFGHRGHAPVAAPAGVAVGRTVAVVRAPPEDGSAALLRLVDGAAFDPARTLGSAVWLGRRWALGNAHCFGNAHPAPGVVTPDGRSGRAVRAVLWRDALGRPCRHALEEGPWRAPDVADGLRYPVLLQLEADLPGASPALRLTSRVPVDGTPLRASGCGRRDPDLRTRGIRCRAAAWPGSSYGGLDPDSRGDPSARLLPGDSGGPVLQRDPHGAWRVLVGLVQERRRRDADHAGPASARYAYLPFSPGLIDWINATTPDPEEPACIT